MSTPDPVASSATPTPHQHASRLPPQVQRQVDRARELEAQQRAALAAPAPGDPPPTPPVAEPAPAAPAEPPQPQRVSPSPIAVGKLSLPELIRLADYSAPDPTREDEPSYWKARFMVADGIAKKTRQVNDENRTLREENDQLKGKVKDLETQLAAGAAAPAAPPEDIDLVKLGFSPEQIEEYGADFLKAQIRASQTIIDQRVEAQVKPIKEREAKSRKDDEHRRQEDVNRVQQEFIDKVTALLPEWKAIDESPGWQAWCKEEDEEGVPRQAILDIYIAKRNVERTVGMFKQYLKASGALEVPPQPAPLPPASAPADQGGIPSSMQQTPFPMTKKGYKAWKSQLARSPGQLWRGNKELTAQIEARYNAAIHAGTLP